MAELLQAIVKNHYVYGCNCSGKYWEHTCQCHLSMEETSTYDELIDKALRSKERCILKRLKCKIADKE